MTNRAATCALRLKKNEEFVSYAMTLMNPQMVAEKSDRKLLQEKVEGLLKELKDDLVVKVPSTLLESVCEFDGGSTVMAQDNVTATVSVCSYFPLPIKVTKLIVEVEQVGKRSQSPFDSTNGVLEKKNTKNFIVCESFVLKPNVRQVFTAAFGTAIQQTVVKICCVKVFVGSLLLNCETEIVSEVEVIGKNAALDLCIVNVPNVWLENDKNRILVKLSNKEEHDISHAMLFVDYLDSQTNHMQNSKGEKGPVRLYAKGNAEECVQWIDCGVLHVWNAKCEDKSGMFV